MNFHIRRDAKQWFSSIYRHFSVDWDMYYFCVMAGLAAGKRSPLEYEQASDLTPVFPAEYREKSKLLVGMLIVSEAKRLGIDLADRDAVTKIIKDYVDPDSGSKLSSEGVKAMNDYAAHGYEILTEKFPERPETLDFFLMKYNELLGEIDSWK